MAALYGLLAEFDAPEALVAAATRAREKGYRKMDAYSPFPVEGLEHALHLPKSPLPKIVLAAGLAGAAGGYGLQYYASVVSYPLIVGGKPPHAWPAFIPVTFETTILAAALAAVFGMLALNGLPQPYHPVFNVPGFERAGRDRFFLCLESKDPLFDWKATRRFLEELSPLQVFEVEAGAHRLEHEDI